MTLAQRGVDIVRNLVAAQTGVAAEGLANCRSVKGDACHLPHLPAKSFDLVVASWARCPRPAWSRPRAGGDDRTGIATRHLRVAVRVPRLS